MSELDLDKEVEKRRKKRARKKRRKKFFKRLLIIIGIIIIAVAAFIITVKICKPDYDFKSFIPENISHFVNEKFGSEIEESVSVSQTTTEPSTKLMDYLSFDEFDFNLYKQGNHMGNLLGNGRGKVGIDASYIYHIVDKKGIYRFYPSTEDYAIVYSSKAKLSCLNLRGDFIYFINDDNHCLYKLQKGTKKPVNIAENVKFAYVYDSSVYYITTDNKAVVMGAKELKPIELYSAASENNLNFVGISLNRVFFTETDPKGVVEYLTADCKGKGDIAHFRENGDISDTLSLQLENGFFYYYELQQDTTYNLCRQKFGSEKVITLLKNVSCTDYVIIDSNRLYYSVLDGSQFLMKEYNMNSDSKRVLLSVSGVNEDNTLAILHGDEYDFIIGAKSANGEDVYKAGCIYTGSTNVMNFKDGKWKY